MILLVIDTTTFPGNMLLPGGIALVVLWLMLRLVKRRRNPSRIIAPAEQVEQRRQVRGVRADLEDVMVEVEQLAKRFSAQLDAKSMRLEKLIDDADARIAELERRQPAGGAVAPAPTGEGQSPPTEPVTAAAAQSVPSEPEPPSTTESEAAQAIYRLADAGNDAVEIARALGEHVGKVELILALRET